MKYLFMLFTTFLLFSCGSEQDQATDQIFPKQGTDTLTAPEDSAAVVVEEVILDDEFEGCSIEITAALSDPDPSGFTNIRKSPGGDIALKFDRNQDEYGEFFLNIVDQEDGWFKINDIPAMDLTYEIPGGEGWIHGSLCWFGSRNYGGSELKLYAKADEGSQVVQRFEEEQGFTLLGVCGDWAKVKGDFDGKIVVGWIQTEWLCGNPVTTCS